MKNVPLLLTLFCFILYRILLVITENDGLSLSVFILPVVLLFFNLFASRSLRFESWFLVYSKWMYDAKYVEIESDIEIELLMEKLQEIAVISDLRLMDIDEQHQKFLFKTKINRFTWGENCYVKLFQRDDITIIGFTTITVFGSYSWNRNNRNVETFILSFENTLTI